MIPEKEDKYSRILDSAIKVFADSGVDNSTVAKIASMAGVADGTIYLYFKNKKDILIQFAKDRGEKIFLKFEQEIKKGKNAKEKMYNLFLSHLKEFSSNRDLAVVFQSEISRLHHAEPHIKALSQRYRRLISDIIDLGKKEGSVDLDADNDFIKNALSGAVNETINIKILNNKKIDVEQTASGLINLVFNGIGVTS